MTAYQAPETYITYFPSNNGRTVELYTQHGNYSAFVVRLNGKLVAVADKHLAFHWLFALVQPEHHGEVERLYADL